MVEIYFVRHSIPIVDSGICYGQSDIGLSTDFERHAGRIIQTLPAHADAVFSSPLSRCYQLALRLPYHLNVQIEARLMELNFGDWEMQPWDKIDPNDPWFLDYLNLAPPRGESYYQLYIRVSEFLEEIIKSAFGTIVIVTHAGVIRAANVFSGKCNLEESLKRSVHYGSVHYFAFEKK